MLDINILAVLVAAFASFIFGALWYSPVLFMNRWCQETGIDPNSNVTNPAKVYGITFLLTLVSAVVFAAFLGREPALSSALIWAVVVGLGLVAASMAINYQFANRSLVHWMIDSGFHIGRFIIIGIILGLWH